MNNDVAQVVRRIARYVIYGMIIKAISWLFRKTTSSIVSIILIIFTAWFAWFAFYHYRDFVIEKVSDFWIAWTNYKNR